MQKVYHKLAIGLSPSGKARGFDLRIRRFESCQPSQILTYVVTTGPPLTYCDKTMSDIMVFTGNANTVLAEKVVSKLNISLGKATVGKFSDGETHVEVKENVRGKDVFILQSTCSPSNDNLMELLLMADALHRASAGRITAVIPYYGYARQDRRIHSARVPITAKVVGDMISSAGVDRLLTVDLHADQIQGFFSIPVDNIYASPVLIGDILNQNLKDFVIVSPDVGGVVRARAYAKNLGDVELAIIDKRRPKPNESQVMNIIGSVEGKAAILVDDMIDTAGTICKAADALKENGATKVMAYSTHPVLSGKAIDNIHQSTLDELIVTDTIPLSDKAQQCKKIRQISLDEMLSESIRRVSQEVSISSMFSS